MGAAVGHAAEHEPGRALHALAAQDQQVGAQLVAEVDQGVGGLTVEHVPGGHRPGAGGDLGGFLHGRGRCCFHLSVPVAPVHRSDGIDQPAADRGDRRQVLRPSRKVRMAGLTISGFSTLGL